MAMATPITQRRMEARYAVPLEAVSEIEAVLPEVASPIEHVKGRRAAFVTALYLDRPDLSLARAATLDPTASEEIRTEEQYFHEDGLVPTITIEWRGRRETWSDRRRFDLPKEKFAAFCVGTLREEEVRVAQPAGGELAGVEAFRRARSCARGLLLPRFAVTCVRRAFTIHSPRIRLTLDTCVRFHAAPSAPYQGPGALSARRLGEAFYTLSHAVLEVKSASELPSRLKELLKPMARTTTSEFVVGAGHRLSK